MRIDGSLYLGRLVSSSAVSVRYRNVIVLTLIKLDKVTYVRFNNFNAQRKRSAEKLGNPRLLKIHFHTLRHWKATMEYHRTKDILYVMKLLGHKNIANTLIYTQLIEFEGDDKYYSAVAQNLEEAQKLIEIGFEYVCDHENMMLFGKRK